MGKRSRKRAAAPERGELSPSGTTRADRDAARRRRVQAQAAAAKRSDRPRRRSRRPSMDERPPAPWGRFPLVEIVVLIAIVLFVGGLVIRGERGITMLIASLVLGSLAGLELSIREHFAGYRSHTTLLAAVAAFAAMAATFFAAGRGDAARILLVPVAGIVFVGSFWLLRQTFKRRSGELGFR